MLRNRIALALLGLALQACSTSRTAADPSSTSSGLEVARSRAGLTCRCLGHDDRALLRPLKLEVTNATEVVVYVIGFHSLRDPATKIEVARQDGTWIDVTPMRGCGDGVAWLPLDPGESADFDRWIWANVNPELAPMRIGVIYRFRGGDLDDPDSWLTAWTPPFTPDELIDDAALARQLMRGR